MSELSVKEFIRKTLEDNTRPPVPVAFYKQRPKQTEVGDQAVCVVWQRRSTEQRFTVNRPFGQKMVQRIMLIMIWMRYDDAQAGGDAYDFFKDDIGRVIRAITIPTNVTDPETGEESTIVFIGETIQVENNEPVLDESLESSVVLTGVMTLPISEMING